MSDSKLCPRCGASYDSTIAFCAKDGARLVRGGQTADLIGTVIAERYRVVARIGEGGMGQVYLAEHVRMKRKSAIKIMRPSLVGEVEALQRFTREAENASQLSHPNIASIYDFGETPDGVVYLAMEYVDGDSLSAKLDHYSALHPDVAADILGQAADALQAAHDVNMLHRDVKPDNIMLGKRADGTYMVKLVDFGIARTMDGSDQRVTRTGFAVGTPQYMSPEQLAGDTLDARSDQYSLALVAFYSLTGQQAFPADSTKESLIARLTSRPRTLRDAKQDVQWPLPLQDVFDQALAPEPTERFVSVSDFAHALSGAISGMTPSQTAEIYRRALDVRVANVAARTPHSDMERLRTPSGALSTFRTTSTVEPSAPTSPNPNPPANRSDSTAPGSSTGTPPITQASVTASTSTATAAAADAPASQASGVTAAPTGPTLSDTATPLPRQARTADTIGDPMVETTPQATPQATGDAGDEASRRPRARWPIALGAVASVAALAFVVTRLSRDASQVGTPELRNAVANPPAGRTDERNVVEPAGAMALRDSADKASALTIPAVASSDTAGSTSRVAPPSTSPAPPRMTQDSLKRVRDSARKANAALAKERADSIARANSVRARFPEAAARAMLARGVDARARMAKKDEFRVVIMSTPVFVWRDEQVRGWKNAHPSPTGEPFAAADPIEYWSPWSTVVAARRAVYVIEVTTDRAPWPSYEPEKLFDLKRGDVDGVELLRDGVAVPLDAPSRIPSLVNAASHSAAGRRVPNAFVATVAPTTFVPRDDGTMATFELVVRDGMRNGAVTRIALNASMVRRLYDDFAPWRDALSRQ